MHITKLLQFAETHEATREVVKSLSLEMYKKCVDALKKMVSGQGGDGLMVGLHDLRGLFQP